MSNKKVFAHLLLLLIFGCSRISRNCVLKKHYDKVYVNKQSTSADQQMWTNCTSSFDDLTEFAICQYLLLFRIWLRHNIIFRISINCVNWGWIWYWIYVEKYLLKIQSNCSFLSRHGMLCVNLTFFTSKIQHSIII